MIFSTAQILTALQKSDQEAASAARYLRKKSEIQDQIDVLSKVSSDDHRALEYLTGNCFAWDWKLIWTNCSLSTITNSQRAINWFTATALKYTTELRAHVKKRTEVTHAILGGKWATAERLIQEHKDTFGHTLWGLFWVILVAEESHGPKTRADLVETFRGEHFGEVIPLFASFFGLSSDKTLPEEHFRQAVKYYLPKNAPALAQFLELLLIEDYSGAWSAWEVFQFCEYLPLIDRYEFFIRLVTIAYGSNHDESVKLGRAAVRLADVLGDPFLDYIADCTNDQNEGTSFNACSEAELLLVAWDAYMASNYHDCSRIASTVAQMRPELLTAHELLVKSRMYLGKPQEASETSPLALFWQHLRNVFSKNEQSEDSLRYLLRFGTRYRILTMTGPLRALHALHSSPVSDEKWFRRAAFSFGAHGPRNFEYGFPPNTNRNYLERCAKAFPTSITIRFFYALSQGLPTQGTTGCEIIPIIRHYFFGGLAAARRSEFEESLKMLCKFLDRRVFVPSPSQLRIDSELHALLQQCERDQSHMEVIRRAWTAELKVAPRLILGVIASGAAVVQSQQLVDEILSKSRKVVGLDMEAYAVFQAAHLASAPRPRVFVAKSVSDFADKRKNDSWQQYAAFTSARFVYEFFTNAVELQIGQSV